MSPMRRLAVSAALTTIALGPAPHAVGQDLAALARDIGASRHRASSGLFDPESNRDSRQIEPGETITLAELDGPGEIRHLWFTIGALDRRFSRSLVLRIYWDGADVPSVETPIGDFFAAGHGMRANISSLPIEVTSYGRALNSYWPMPFRTKARLTMTNEASVRVTSCYYYVDWMKYDVPPDRLVYFHARYRQEFPVVPFTPYTVAEITGRGHYVGTVLSIQSSMGSWLGEADDRFSVDGEAEPSLVGTGLEDYFTDAWNLRRFTNLRAGVSIYEPKGQDQRATMYRWHIADPITFRRSLKVHIERRSYAALIDPATGRETTWDFKYRPDVFSSVAFWYASEPAPRFWDFPPLGQRVNPEIFVETTLMIDRLRTSPGTRAERRYSRSGNATSGDARNAMTWIENDRVGGWVEVPVTVTTPGPYSISVYQMLFRTFGIWKVSLRRGDTDILLHPAMDFHDRFVTEPTNMPENVLYGTWFEHKVGIHALVPGEYVVRFECLGANPLARHDGVTYTQGGTRRVDPDAAGRPGYEMGLDGISLRLLPWDDMWTWMQDYLQREQRQFDQWIAAAEATIRDLVSAIERFREDVGEYPAALVDLVEPPARVKGRPGRWPYVAGGRIPRDPWGQLYRYRAAGVRNPAGFDVYSVHGNERDPRVWIGNWREPGGPPR